MQNQLIKAAFVEIFLIREESKHLIQGFNLCFFDVTDLDFLDGLSIVDLSEDAMLQNVWLPFSSTLVDDFFVDFDPS